MSYVLGTGYWMAWHALLWLALAPFLWYAVPLARTSPGDHSRGLDLAFALCNLGFVLLLVTGLVSAALWALAPPGAGVRRFLWPAVLYLLGASLGGAALYAILYYVTGHAATAAARWGWYLVLLAGVLAVHWFSLHAAWRFRVDV